MAQEITLAQMHSWLLAYAVRISDQEAYLTELDAAIGDADHGANMRRGLDKIQKRLSDSERPYEDINALLRMVAMTLVSTVGGAAGPLYGAFFLGAVQTGDQENTAGDGPEDGGPDGVGAADDEITLQQLAVMFRKGLIGLQQRGKAQLEDKTMLDALEPAVVALEDAAEENRSVQDALEAARSAAEAGMKHTIDLQANRGRASYLGPRSIGHQDPGATSLYYLIETAAATLGRSEAERKDALAAVTSRGDDRED